MRRGSAWRSAASSSPPRQPLSERHASERAEGRGQGGARRVTRLDSDELGAIVPAVRIGVLTGGGDCPGLNAVIRAIVRKGIDGYGHAIVGFRDGWRGPLENAYEELTIESTRGILPRGGTILRLVAHEPVRARRRARADRARTCARSTSRG